MTAEEGRDNYLQNIENIEICKAIRRRMAEQIRTYDKEKQLQALEPSKGLKSLKKKQCLGRSSITTLEEEEGTLLRDFDRMIQRWDEFYTKLYSARHTGPPTTNVHSLRHGEHLQLAGLQDNRWTIRAPVTPVILRMDKTTREIKSEKVRRHYSPSEIRIARIG